MIELKGFGDLARVLSDAQKAIAGLDGDIGTISFNPHEPASLEAAIARMEALIDERLRGYERNPIVKDLAAQANPRGRRSCQGKVGYRGPVSPTSGGWPKIKLDLTADEALVLPSVRRPVFHPYSDMPADGMFINS